MFFIVNSIIVKN